LHISLAGIYFALWKAQFRRHCRSLSRPADLYHKWFQEYNKITDIFFKNAFARVIEAPPDCRNDKFG
jgi:hypothetical protein